MNVTLTLYKFITCRRDQHNISAVCDINISMQHSAQHSVELKVKEPLPKGMAGTWARTVFDHGPPGISAETQLMIGREPVNSRLYLVRGNSGYHYVVPLARDLDDDEVEAIARAWDATWPDGDFAINWTQNPRMDREVALRRARVRDDIAEQAAKRYHAQWLQSRVDEGWSFAHRLDPRGKRHPMLQAWHSLPERYRISERERFRTLLDVLESLDLTVTHE
jgi:RyR domain